jgi:hypothetical protein
MMFYDGLDVFVELFLEELPQANDVRFGNRKGLWDSMKRYEQFDHQEETDISEVED